MAPPTLSYGLNLPNKNKGPSLGKPSLAAGQKRKKTIFDSDSEDEGNAKGGGDDNNGAVEITTIGGLQEPSPPARSRQTSKSKSKEQSPPKCRPDGSKPTLKPLKNSLFGDDDEDEDTAANNNRHDRNSKSKPRTTGTSKDYTNLAALHSTRKHAQTAQELDPSIYSYDAIYDSIHSKPEKSTSAETEGAGPKYMGSLLRSAEVRKRDQLRARDRLLAKEREAEGDDFADKEKFVTAAYKAQQEEVRRLEEEEARREKEEEERRKREGGTGMVGFYRDMLARGEERHGEAMKAAEEAARRVKAGEIVEDDIPPSAETDAAKEKSEAQLAAELNAKGAHIVINDEGQVVDKRQLLAAGLNVVSKPKPTPSAPSATDPSKPRPGARPGGVVSDAHLARNAQRARQTEMVAAQLEEKARQEAEEEAARQREIAERTKTRKTETDVSSAKERYLARKREREEAAKKEKGNG